MRWAPERLEIASYPEPGIDLPVFYGDLDTNGHVNNVAMGRYFEMGRFEAHRRIGIGRTSRQYGGHMLVAHVGIDYLAEVHFGSLLHVRTRVVKIGRSSISEEQAAWQNGSCVALCESVAAYRKDGAAVELPDHMCERIATLQMPDAGAD
jgi:acyl-CoA thioester hydrolase